jgi:hypothetical protein
MFFIISIVSFIIIQFFKLSLECESNATIWTYYPCSFIISSTAFHCPYVSIHLAIDQCTNREITFFWHFPSGNMTLTLQSDNHLSFLLRFSKTSLSRKKLIKDIYHLINNKTSEERLIHNNRNEMITIHSDKYNQCSLKFETSQWNIFDYGTFIRMTILTDENNTQ